MKEFVQKLIRIQSTLKAPKSQFNKFGNYNYRSAEDILEAVKPLLFEQGLLQTISNEVVCIGMYNYVKCTVEVTDGENTKFVTAYAREAAEAKGMSPSQLSGSSESYAKKYALGDMYNIDDNKDADATNTHGKDEVKTTNLKTTTSDVTNGKANPDTQPQVVIPTFKKPKIVDQNRGEDL